MITFSCPCQHRFEVDDALAGESIQCPQCSRLVDVPHLDELDHLNDDGTIKLSDDFVPPPKLDLREATRTFSRDKHDESGREKDLRPTVEEFLRGGSVDPNRRSGPREMPPAYDPFTGELIRELELKQEPEHTPPEAIPLAKPALGYATRAAVPSRYGFGLAAVFLHLFHPGNLFVWMLVGLIHALNLFLLRMPLIGTLYLFFFFFPVLLVLAGHFGNVIDETGREEHDELPAPMRSASFGEDVWKPFVQLAIAGVLAASPTLLAGFFFSDAPEAVWWATAAIFYFAWPAFALTAVLSGAANNLLPHRALGVIPPIGLRYLLPVVCVVAGVELLTAGSAMMLNVGNRALAWLMATGVPPPVTPIYPLLNPLLENTLAPLLLLVASYLLHAAAWMLGLLYRQRHEQFPWVLQKHVSTRADTQRQLEERRRQQLEQARAASAPRTPPPVAPAEPPLATPRPPRPT